MSEKEKEAPKLFMNEAKKETPTLGLAATVTKPAQSVAWQQPVAPAGRKYPLWYRYRAAFGSLFIVNVAIGAYVLFKGKPKPRTPKKSAHKGPEQSGGQLQPMTPVTSATDPSHKSKLVIDQHHKREILQWNLDEMRKLSPSTKVQKAKINEEKRYLKELIRGDKLPTLPHLFRSSVLYLTRLSSTA